MKKTKVKDSGTSIDSFDWLWWMTLWYLPVRCGKKLTLLLSIKSIVSLVQASDSQKSSGTCGTFVEDESAQSPAKMKILAILAKNSWKTEIKLFPKLKLVERFSMDECDSLAKSKCATSKLLHFKAYVSIPPF